MSDFINKLIIARNHKRHKTIKLPRDLNTFLQSQNITNWQGRIIYSILNLMRDYQYSDGHTLEGQHQLDLFKMYWNDDNSTVTFNFHFSDFVPRNLTYKRKQIEQALKDLVTIGLAEQEEIINGKAVKRFTGIIFNPIWEAKGHSCSFQMTSSWFKVFSIAIPYENWLFEEALLLTSRARKFSLLLNQYEFIGGFWKYRKDLCVFFGIEITRVSNIEKDFLFPLREELDSKGELSFNYGYNKSNDKFEFKIYRLKNAEADKIIPANIHKITSPNLNIKLQSRDIVKDKKIAINSAIKYIIKARELNKDQQQILFNLCLRYGYEEIKNSIKNTTKNNVENSFKNVKGQLFIEKLLYKFPL